MLIRLTDFPRLRRKQIVVGLGIATVLSQFAVHPRTARRAGGSGGFN